MDTRTVFTSYHGGRWEEEDTFRPFKLFMKQFQSESFEIDTNEMRDCYSILRRKTITQIDSEQWNCETQFVAMSVQHCRESVNNIRRDFANELKNVCSQNRLTGAHLSLA